MRFFVGPPSFRLSATGRRGRGTGRGRGTHVRRHGHATAAITSTGGRRGRRHHGVSLLGPDGHFEFLFDQQTGADVLHARRGHRRTGGTGRVLGRGRAARVMAFERVHYVHDRVDHVGRVEDRTVGRYRRLPPNTAAATGRRIRRHDTTAVVVTTSVVMVTVDDYRVRNNVRYV